MFRDRCVGVWFVWVDGGGGDDSGGKGVIGSWGLFKKLKTPNLRQMPQIRG
jgi:hypothetical protein